MVVSTNIALRVIQLCLQVAITLFIARMAGAEGNGYFSLFITETSLFVLLLGLSADSGIIYFAGKRQANLSQITTVVVSLIAFQLVAGLLIYFIAGRATGYRFFELSTQGSHIALGFIYVFSMITISYYTGYNNSQGRFNGIIIYNIIINLLLLALLLEKGCSMPLHNNSLPVIVSEFVLASLIYAVVLVIYTYSKNKEPIKFNDYSILKNRPFIKYVLNACFGNIVQFLAYRMDIWFVNYYDTKHDVGNYALASKLAQFWLVLPQFIGAFIFPVTASGTAHKFNFKRMAGYILIFNAVSGIAVIFIYTLFIKYFLKPDFNDSYLPFLFLLPGIVVFSVNTMLAAHLAGIGYVRINRQGSVLCFAVILLLDIILIPRFGIIGAAIASSVGYTASTLFVVVNYLKLKTNESLVADNLVP